MADVRDTNVLDRAFIRLGRLSVERDEAITAAGELLVERGLVTESYISAMHDREETVSTFMGNGVALPHGTHAAKASVLGTGIVVLQYPDGVEWPNGTAKLVIGLAAANEDHVAVLSQLAEVLMDEDLSNELAVSTDVEFIYSTLTGTSG